MLPAQLLGGGHDRRLNGDRLIELMGHELLTGRHGKFPLRALVWCPIETHSPCQAPSAVRGLAYQSGATSPKTSRRWGHGGHAECIEGSARSAIGGRQGPLV